ncbi:NAD-dependent epimerase/dehydratase family protein [Altererythrobacter litoralis]|uniref:NAD(P)H-binding protein n=1 Tax=Altererythrobacter litoralis TaxID=3113904 RepID=A0ABU7GDZ9_9SPHN|nr:NAD(P)H-binding protein [Erythrobacteraceae bacterium 1XM1-14]
MSGEVPFALTGGSGFVGQAVLDVLGDRNEPAGALVRRVTEHDHSRVEWVTGDLHNKRALDHLVAGARGVIHVAGLTNAPDPAEFEAANVEGTAQLIAAAKQAGAKRFVFVSSLSAREPELSAYGASKAKAEKLVEDSGLDWTIVRPPAVYGPRDRDMFELFRSASFGFVPLPPGGATSIIHAHDLARLLVDLVDAQPALVRNRTFEPDDAREGGWSHKELAAAIGQAVGRRVFAPHLPRAVLQGAAGVDRLLRGAGAKLTQDRVGYMCHPNWVVRSDRKVPEEVWQPQIAGEAGFKATADWYRQQGWL